MSVKTCIMFSLDFVGEKILAHYTCDNPERLEYFTKSFHNCRFADYPSLSRKERSVCRHYQKQSAQCGNRDARMFALRRAGQCDVNKWLGNAVTMLMVALCVAACAGPHITPLDVEIARAHVEAQRACYAAQMLPDYADARDAALVAMARALTGDPCKQVNVYEARAQIAASQNAAAGQIIGTVATAGIAGVGIIAGADVLKTAVKHGGPSITGDNNIATTASGQAAANHDQSSRTSSTHVTMPEARQ